MSYQLLSLKDRIAKKPHPCIWCDEMIAAGERYKDERSVSDGFQAFKWHPECWDASQKYFKENTFDDEFEAHACKRGTNEER